jgi:hypothetical protein
MSLTQRMGDPMTPAAPQPTPVDADTAALARALLPRAIAAFTLVPELDRGPALAAIDRFLAGPAPSTYLAAARELRTAERAAALRKNGGATMSRLFGEGMTVLREVPGLPPELLDEMTANLPLDARSGRRLTALAELLGGYCELLGRVAADTEEMRKRMKRRSPRSQAAARPRK